MRGIWQPGPHQPKSVSTRLEPARSFGFGGLVVAGLDKDRELENAGNPVNFGAWFLPGEPSRSLAKTV